MTQRAIETEIGGTVLKIHVREGDRVARDDLVILIESMKMEIQVDAPEGGIVVKVLVAEGDVVAEGQTIAILDLD